MSWLAILAATAANIGTNVHLPPADRLDLAVELGGRWVRIDLNWDIAQPQPGAFQWAPFDAVIGAARARGLSVYATLGYTPAWASTGDRRGDGPTNDVPDAAAFRAFVEAAVDRYRNDIAVFGTWNEPNLAQFFEGSRTEWIDIVYRPAVQAIRARCSTCTIAGPEVATVGDLYDDYIRAALAAEVPTVLAAHIYSAFPEDDPDAGFGKDSFYNKLEHRRVIGPFQGTESIREAAIATGHGDLPIWITETGREAPPGDSSKLEAQRRYVERVLDAMATRPWWQTTLFYELTEEHPGGAFADIHWGLALATDPGFDRKPAFTYLQERLAALPPADDAGADGPGDPVDAGAGPNAANDAGTDDPSGRPAGCGCASGTPDGGTWGVILLVAVVLLRRRA